MTEHYDPAPQTFVPLAHNQFVVTITPFGIVSTIFAGIGVLTVFFLIFS